MTWKQRRIFRAIQKGKATKACKLIAACQDIGFRDDDGKTALIVASECGHKEIAETIIDKGSELDARDRCENTALILALDKGHKDVARLLIDRGADVNPKNNGGWTPLFFAATDTFTDIAKLLIDRGANVNARSQNSTALITATLRNQQETVKLLLERGADANLPWSSEYPYPPLATAIEHGALESAKILVAHGADVNTRLPDGSTPLILAVRRQGSQFVELLVANGADIDAQDDHTRTAIKYAGERNDKTSMAILITAKAVAKAQKAGHVKYESQEWYKQYVKLEEQLLLEGPRGPRNAALADQLIQSERYFEALRGDGFYLCANPECPCGNRRFDEGEGYLLISKPILDERHDTRRLYDLELAVFRKHPGSTGEIRHAFLAVSNPVLMCEIAAMQRNLNLEAAAYDAKLWWVAGIARLRESIRVGDERISGAAERTSLFECHSCHNTFEVKPSEGSTLHCPECKSVLSDLHRFDKATVEHITELPLATMECNCVYCNKKNSGILVTDALAFNGSFYSQKIDDTEGAYIVKTECIHCGETYNIAWDCVPDELTMEDTRKSQNGQTSSTDDTNQLKQKLWTLIKQGHAWGSQNSWPTFEKYPQYEEIRSIGEELNNIGGMQEMLAGHKYVYDKNPTYGQMIERIWNRIGKWLA